METGLAPVPAVKAAAPGFAGLKSGASAAKIPNCINSTQFDRYGTPFLPDCNRTAAY